MNNVLCIFPKDSTIEFLEPLFIRICDKYSASYLIGDPQDDDDYLDKLIELSARCDTIIFLGHGSSEVLYGVNFNELIHKDNVNILRGKKLVLFACNSVEFIRNNKLTNAIGFGVVPTSDYDIQVGHLHSLTLKDLLVTDLDYIKNTIVRIWLETISETDISDVNHFYSVFSYNTTVEIVKCLTKREPTNFRLISDILYYLKTDMNYIDS
jgi:hypothetical protein